MSHPTPILTLKNKTSCYEGKAKTNFRSWFYGFCFIRIKFFSLFKRNKRAVRKEQEGRCDWCGKKVKKLQIHHIIPQRMKGKDTRENAVGLCEDCHRYWDDLSFQGIFYGKK